MRNRKISVIGGAGFVGTNLCQRFAESDTDFEIIDLKPSQRFSDRSKIADVRQIDTLREAVSGNVVVNLAAVHRDDVADSSEYYDTNVGGAKNITSLCQEKNIHRIIFTSTVAVYGFVDQETGEDGAKDPFNDYGKSKLQAEEVFNRWGAVEENTLITIRPTVIFGEGNRGNVHNLFNQIASGRFMMIGNGANKKSMAYIGNVAAYLQHCIDAEVSGNFLCNYVDLPNQDMSTLVSQVRGILKGKHNVGPRLPYGIGLLLGRLADMMAYLTGKKLPISAIRVKKFTANTAFSSNKKVLGNFKEPFTLEEGIARTIQSEFLNPDPHREIFFTE